ncbi:MAG: STAS domain-containing protein [Fulvivirga sp.]
MVDIQRTKEDDYELITIVGEVDASSSIALDNIISEAVESGTKKILVNCTSLEYISSAGLGVFMSYIEAFKQNHISIIIYGLNDKVANVFQILGLDQLMEIKGTKEEAIAALA